MLEVVNLTKIYKSKVGANVKALDGVSVRFPEKGMVFLLGKSGSGKSTLLNVCGGLDSPTSGEIIVKGRSSKHFSQSDFDSYRNTFIGFIFQEYNILNEFSVEDNIALALELQGKPKNKKAIAELLKQVDLAGYAKRKPNTLSGGQKQRIAIARALVKSPEIIMADEPTGALDSATGKQVFDTLKKLSKDKLVIIVSHDRDFAEQYGDRVIELKDGKIISDVSKTEEEQHSISANVTAVGDTLCVKKGSELSDRDFEEIKAFLRNSDGDVVIASGEKDVKTFKEVSRITDDGKKEVFRDTDEEKIEKKEYKPADSKFIRSRLPIRHAVKIGVSGLKTKPVRLFFTILLCTIAFVLFGVSSTMMFYDGDAVFRESLAKSSYNTLVLKKQYIEYEKYYENDELKDTYENKKDTKFTREEMEVLKAEFGDATFAALPFSQAPQNMHAQSDMYNEGYYSHYFEQATYLPLDSSLRNMTYGQYPTEGTNEIAISSYMAEGLLEVGLYDPDTTDNQRYTIQSIADVLNKKLKLGDTVYTVSGIFDSGTLDAKYDKLKESSTSWSLQEEFKSVLSAGMHKVVFVNSQTETALLQNGGSSSNNNDFYDTFYARFPDKYRAERVVNTEKENYSAEYRFSSISAKSKFPISYLDNTKTSLSEGEVIISPNTFSNSLHNYIYNVLDDSKNWIGNEDKKNEIWNAYYHSGNPDGATLQEKLSIQNKLSYFTSSEYNDGEKTFPITEEIREAFLADIFEFMTTYDEYFDFDNNFVITLGVDAASASERLENLKIVGVINYSNFNFDAVYLHETDYNTLAPLAEEKYKDQNPYYNLRETNYVEAENALYSSVFIDFDRSEASIDLLMNTINIVQSDDSFIALSNPITKGIEMANNLIDNLQKAFMIIGIVLAVFSALLLCNFISVSISHKKKEIGILRAVGARSLDVFKIFFSESFVISLICIILSTIGSIFACGGLNGEVANMLSGVSVFVFGAVSFLLLVGVALVTALVATFLPVWNAAKKKPVDSIRAL